MLWVFEQVVEHETSVLLDFQRTKTAITPQHIQQQIPRCTFRTCEPFSKNMTCNIFLKTKTILLGWQIVKVLALVFCTGRIISVF